MKKLNITFAMLLTVVLFVQFSGAVVDNDSWDKHLTILNLPLSSDLTIEKFISLCTKENCVINEDSGAVTILSYYNNEVVLTLVKDIAEGAQENEILMIVNLPEEIDSGSYDWEESVRTDLSQLRDLGVLDISEQDISSMTEAYSKFDPAEITTTTTFSGEWQYSETCREILKSNEPKDCFFASGENSYSFDVLPEEEFVLNKDTTSGTYLFFIIGIAVILIIIFLIFARKKN